MPPHLPSVVLAAFVGAVTAVACLWRRQRGLLRQVAELQASETRFRLLFERSPDASMLFDTGTGLFTHCNEAALRLLRCTQEWAVGKHPWELAPPVQAGGIPTKERALELIAQMNREGSVRFEWQHSRGDGTSFPAEISITALEIKHQPLQMAIIRDMTEWKRAQVAADQANQTLERRVEERTVELQQAEQSLRQALAAERELSELKSNFVSMVSHEFRTPLGIISSSAQILDRYYTRLEDRDRQEHLGAICTAVRRMAAMMENVLLLSRMDRSWMEFAPLKVEVRSFCLGLVDELRSSTSAPSPIRLTIAPEVPEFIHADANLLRHILTNLLSNAVKYSPADKEARLSLHAGPGHVRFTVEDEGIGIPEADREHLFQTFHRGSNVGQRPGTGLGLVIVKRCCDLHGATITFTSTPPHGTSFVVHLPLTHS